MSSSLSRFHTIKFTLPGVLSVVGVVTAGAGAAAGFVIGGATGAAIGAAAAEGVKGAFTQK